MATKPKKEEPEQPETDKQQPAPPLEQASPEQPAVEQPKANAEPPADKQDKSSGEDPGHGTLLEGACILQQANADPSRLDIVVRITCCLMQTPRYVGEFYQKERRAVVLAKAVELADEIIAATES